ncbi:MAG: hypothetical protein LC791_15595 [Acidobacteria bacterium]|nr:hypothetical protein [Acidobacteriota bacterium]
MSSKRYEYRVLETAELAELERQLTELGADGWSAEGYGVLPSGERSVLLSRRPDRHKHHDHDHDKHRRARFREDEEPPPTRLPSDRVGP